jgi:hypothetical protein
MHRVGKGVRAAFGRPFCCARCDGRHGATRDAVLSLELQRGRAARSFQDVLSSMAT